MLIFREIVSISTKAWNTFAKKYQRPFRNVKQVTRYLQMSTSRLFTAFHICIIPGKEKTVLREISQFVINSVTLPRKTNSDDT